MRFPPPPVARGPKKILLVEDNADLRELLTLVAGLLGCEVAISAYSLFRTLHSMTVFERIGFLLPLIFTRSHRDILSLYG